MNKDIPTEKKLSLQQMLDLLKPYMPKPQVLSTPQPKDWIYSGEGTIKWQKGM